MMIKGCSVGGDVDMYHGLSESMVRERIPVDAKQGYCETSEYLRTRPDEVVVTKNLTVQTSHRFARSTLKLEPVSLHTHQVVNQLFNISVIPMIYVVLL